MRLQGLDPAQYLVRTRGFAGSHFYGNRFIYAPNFIVNLSVYLSPHIFIFGNARFDFDIDVAIHGADTPFSVTTPFLQAGVGVKL